MMGDMLQDMPPNGIPKVQCSCCRRTMLKGVGAAGVAGLAGCTGLLGEDDDLVVDPDDDPDDYPTWDDADPEFPQLLSTLLPMDQPQEERYHRPSTAFLDGIEPRDEPVYGNPPREMPAPEDEQIEPDSLVFARGPTEADVEHYREEYGPLMDLLEEKTGLEVEFFELDTFAAAVEAMRAERLHLCAFDTGTTPFAVNLGGAGERMYLSISTGNMVGYYLWVVTYVGSGIDELDDLAETDGDIAHGSETSNSGNLAPRAMFAELGVEPDEDYEVHYAGGHEQVLRGIHAGDYVAGPVCSSCIHRVYDADDDLDPDDGPGGQPLKVIWQNAFPSGVHIVRYNLAEYILDGIHETYMETDWSEIDEGIGEDYVDFVQVDYASYYHPSLLVHQDLGISYEDDLE